MLNAMPLAILLDEVVRARAALAEQRHMPGALPGSTNEARARMLAALESYTAELLERRLPVPYALRDELRMQRSVCQPSPALRRPSLD